MKFYMPKQRLALACRIVSLSLLCQVGISRVAWMPGVRGFPRSPLLTGIDPWWLEMAGILVLCLGMLLILWKPQKQAGTLLLLAGLAMLVLTDVNRLQPWVFVFAVMLAGILALDLTSKHEKPPQTGPAVRGQNGCRKLGIVRMVIACTWFWSGIMKLNPAFAGDYFPGLMEPFGLGEWALAHPAAAYAAGSVEVLAGAMFVFRRTQKLGLVAGLPVHGFVLASLGPWGLNWNEVVWPWNLAFMALAVLSISPEREFQQGNPKPALAGFFKLKFMPEWGTILLVGILPLLNLFGHWDHFLSHSYYSGRAPTATFYFHPDDRFSIPESARPYVLQIEGEAEFLIPLELWALGEMKIPGYPEIRTRKHAAASLCQCLNRPENAGLRTQQKQGFILRSGSDPYRISSSQIIADTADCNSLLRTPESSHQSTIQ